LEYSRFRDTEERIGKLEDRVVAITQVEQKKEKKDFKTEATSRDLWDNVRCTNILRVPPQKERKG